MNLANYSKYSQVFFVNFHNFHSIAYGYAIACRPSMLGRLLDLLLLMLYGLLFMAIITL